MPRPYCVLRSLWRVLSLALSGSSLYSGLLSHSGLQPVPVHLHSCHSFSQVRPPSVEAKISPHWNTIPPLNRASCIPGDSLRLISTSQGSNKGLPVVTGGQTSHSQSFSSSAEPACLHCCAVCPWHKSR